jgi:hypothetical protein
LYNLTKNLPKKAGLKAGGRLSNAPKDSSHSSYKYTLFNNPAIGMHHVEKKHLRQTNDFPKLGS